MFHQVIFSGNIKKGNSPIITREDATRVCDHAKACKYTGFTIYIDGNYITLYEGDLETIQKSIDHYADSARYSKIMTMTSSTSETRAFSDFTLFLRHSDCIDVIGNVENCLTLTPEYYKNILPKTMPKEYKTLLKTFALVNNARAFQAVA